METDRKLLTALLLVSIAIPLAVLFVSLAMDELSSKVLFVLLMMFILLPLAAMGAFMWITGKAQWMIAGYNTMAKSQQEFYDAEKLSKAVGRMVFAVAIVCLIGFCLIFYVPRGGIVLGVTIALIIVVLIAGILSLRKDKYLKDPTKRPGKPTEQERRKQYIYVGVGVGVTAIILIAVFAFIGSGNVSASLDDEILHVDAPMVNRSVYYDDIVSVEIREDMNYGSRIGGFGGTSVSSGNFNNSEFGDYTLAVYNNVKYCIVVEPISGKVLVFNRGSAEETQSFYQELLDRIGSSAVSYPDI